MPRKRQPVQYPCALEFEAEDDLEEQVEDPSLSGGLSRNFEEDEDRQSLRTDNEDEEGEEDEGGQDEQEQQGEEQDDDDFDSSGADSSDQDDAQKARNRGDGGMPGSGSSRRSRWTPSFSPGTILQRKEWVVISEIPKADRAPDAIRREINNMLTHEL